MAIGRTWLAAVCFGLLTTYVAAAASPIVQLTDDPASALRPAWSPDGKQIAFQSNRAGLYQIFVMNADGSGLRALGKSDQDERHPSWSPDGSKIAVESGTDMQREIWTIQVATGARTQITRLGGIASFPSWSPDGNSIGFYEYRDGALDLWTVGADGGSPKQITQGLASLQKNQCTFACHAPAWSPDSARLAYASGDQAAVWTIRSTDGGDAVQVSPVASDGRNHFPVYTADGRLFYISEHITPGRSWTDVWAIDPNHPSTRDPVLEDVQAQGPFAFSPDQQRILFASPRGGSFQIYEVRLNAEGKEALKVPSADTEMAPGIATREGTPASAPLAAAPVETDGQANGWLSPASLPYLLALGGILALWVGVESALRIRKRGRVNGQDSDDGR